MPTPIERACLALARLTARPIVLVLWGALLAVSTLIAAVERPPARWLLMASTGAAVVGFCLYVALVRRNRQANIVRARTGRPGRIR